MFKVILLTAPIGFFGLTYYAYNSEGSDNAKYSKQSYYKESLQLLKDMLHY